MLLIYVSQISPRLQYVIQLFFGELVKTEFQITTDLQQFQSYNGPKFNYSRHRFGDEVFFRSHDLLFETRIHEQKISIKERGGIKTFFENGEDSDLTFDPFAAAFYSVSRYEEYLPFTPDEFGRFPDNQNLLVREKIHSIPVVNYYAIYVKEILEKKFPQLSFQTSSFQFQLTYDIDFAFAYRRKGLIRNAGGFAKSLLKFDFRSIASRAKVLIGGGVDPYDTFDFQLALHEKFKLKPVYFFLLGDYGTYDKNIFWKNGALQSLIKKISQKCEVGIHSSFASNDHSEKVKTEIERLSQITGKKIIRNRQHFLKLTFPSTYQTLLVNGITEDYTMGFASEVGFRAGIASPFYWYDLSKEEITSLRIFPFAAMDATLRYYKKTSPEEAVIKITKIADEIKKVNGTFILLAHNDLLSDLLWPGWRNKFEEVLKHLCEV